MECVLADEARDMGGEFGEYDATEWAVLVSLYGDIDLPESDAERLDHAGVDEAPAIPSPS